MEVECHSRPERIVIKILQEWLQGNGLLPVTWNTLIETLRKTGLPELAADIHKAKL